MYLRTDVIAPIVEGVMSLRPQEDEVVVLLFGEDRLVDIPRLIGELNDRNVRFFGGVFPGLIYSNRRDSQGCIIKKFKCLLPPFCTTHIATGQLKGLVNYSSVAHVDRGTALVLLDGLTPNIYRFLEKINDLLGENCNFIGGGAGSISLRQQPCVFCNDGYKEDAAVVCVIDHEVQLGVRHGWEHLEGPLVATQTEGNTIQQLNWQPAIEVYSRVVEADCGKRLTIENFAGIAQGYPFGILREKEDDIVRDPLAIGENGSIICIGEVPTNTVVHILKGRPEALLDAARQAVADTGEKTGIPIRAQGTLVVDCITRTLFLDEQFKDEMDIIRDSLLVESENQEPFGILSLGEISSYGDGLLELFNKTIVVGTFY